MMLDGIHENIKLTVSREMVAEEGQRLASLSPVERFFAAKKLKGGIFSNRRSSTTGWEVSSEGLASKVVKSRTGYQKRIGFVMCGRTVWELREDVEIVENSEVSN
jgi:hypothetical protein